MCSTSTREQWVVGLLFLAVLVSLGVVAPMIIITYPGDECLLFVSVRGEALIYGHPSGCYYISAAHCFTIVAALFLTVLFYMSKRAGVRDSGGSNRSLRGSVSRLSQASVGRAKVTQTIIIFSLLLTVFVVLTAIILMSGYIVTCGELQYETRRKIHGTLTLGPSLKGIEMWCYSLFRNKDFHTRFHFDHYELSGQWHGQYTAYKHGRPQTWTGDHRHLMPIAEGMELSMAMAVGSSILWIIITILLMLLRRKVKNLQKIEIAESLEDAKIWASDMASISPPESLVSHNKNLLNQYESLRGSKKDMRKRYNSGHSIGGNTTQQTIVPTDTNTLLEHQQVIAETHPDGSYFQTPDGSYVQLVQGVLRRVEGLPPTADVTTLLEYS